MSFPAYEDRKESGVQWLSDIPLHWDCLRLKRLIADVDSGTSVNASDDPAEPDEFGVLKTSSVYTGEFRSTENKRVFREEYGRVTCPLQENTLIVSRMNTPDLIGAAGLVAEAPDNLFLPDRLWQVSFHDAVPSFMHYWTLTGNYRGQVKSACTGTSASMKNLSQEQFGNFVLAVPPLPEQTAIASFLDTETSKIDSLVDQQRLLIELLKEKRQAVISHAITKGLNPNAPMKPSSIQWLGDVPQHWAVKRLKHVSPFISVGVVVNPSSYISEDSDDLPFIYGGDIREGVIDWANSRRIHPDASATQEKTQLETDDLLVVRVGAPGVTAVVPNECEGGNCASVMLMRKGEFNSHWLCYVMNTRVVRFQVEIVEYGAAQKQFNIAHAVNFWVPVPGRAEQDEMVAHLDRRVGEFDSLGTEAERAIELLQERRTALISAAVTGKIDVREFAYQETA